MRLPIMKPWPCHAGGQKLGGPTIDASSRDAKEAQERRVNGTVRNEILGPKQIADGSTCLTSTYAARRSAAQARRQDCRVTSHEQGHRLRRAPFGRRPDRHLAVAQDPPDRAHRTSEHETGVEACERAAILVHGEQRHVVRGIIVKAHFRLRGSDCIGERSAARHDYDMTGAVRDRGEPIAQLARKSVASTELNDR